LGFSAEWADSCDVEAIKKAYHKAVLMYHPDKAQHKTADGKEDRTVFLKIQEAFNVLSSEPKRRAYDSQLPFDESIPKEDKVDASLAKGPKKFFKLFDPVFKRNARFAVQKPVPELGDLATPIADVYKFYDYWINFESWRDFTGVNCEHNPDDAQSREEKRWMQKENERITKKLKKNEMDRIIQLVMLAQKKDPRIVADKEAKRQAKDADKNAREAIIKRIEEEDAAAKAWDEAAEAAVQEKAATAKADREKQKKLKSNARNVLRKLLRHTATLGQGSGEYGIVSAPDVELICSAAELDDLTDINKAFGGDAATKDTSLFLESGAAVILEKLEGFKEQQARIEEEERLAKQPAAAPAKGASPRKGGGASAAATGPVEREWAREQLSILARAVQRYPAGFANRWGSVTTYLNGLVKPAEPFTESEILRTAYKLANGLFETSA